MTHSNDNCCEIHIYWLITVTGASKMYPATYPAQPPHSLVGIMPHHRHLGSDVLLLLLLVQGTVVPLQVADGWVEPVYIVGASHPRLGGTVLLQEDHAVATVRVACCYDEDVVWNGLCAIKRTCVCTQS